MNSKEQSIKRQLQCTNCGTEIKQLTPSKVKKPGEPVAEELEEITCPVCTYRFVAAVQETEAPLLSREDFGNKLRQLIWAANRGGRKGGDIIESLRRMCRTRFPLYRPDNKSGPGKFNEGACPQGRGLPGEISQTQF